MSCYSSSLKGSLCSFEHTGIHNHNNVADITKTVIKDVIVRLPNCWLPNCQVIKLLVTKLSSYQIIGYQIVSYQNVSYQIIS